VLIRYDSRGAYRDHREGHYASGYVTLNNEDTVTDGDNLPGHVDPSADHLAGAQSKAFMSLTSQTTNSVQIGVDVGEIEQMVNMIAINIARIGHAAKSLRHGNLTDVANALRVKPRRGRGPMKLEPDNYKNLANYWLEFIYGWRPLLQDIYGSIESLGKYLEHNSWNLVVKAKGRESSNFTVPLPDLITPLGGLCGAETHSIISRCKYVIYYRRDDHVKILATELGLTNPLSIAWELLPFSFVVDWFLPIGSYLETLHAFDGLQFISGVKSKLTTEECQTEIYKSWEQGGNPSRTIVFGGSRSRRTVRFDRTVMGDFPSPTPPFLKSPISVIHATNALALLTSIFKK